MNQISANRRSGPVLITLLISMCVSADGRNITVRMGSGVMLPCSCPHVSSLLSWQKGITIVYSDRRNSAETSADQQYSGRTRVLESNCSLVLSRVQLSDEGEYSCYYQTSSFSVETVTLHVTADASCEYKSGLYHCKATWGSPEGWIVWRLNGQSKFLHSVFFQRKLDEDSGLYIINDSANITSNGAVTCEVETSGKTVEIVECNRSALRSKDPESLWNVLLVSVVCGALVVLLIATCSWIIKRRIKAHGRIRHTV
ncbi:CXADR-like membrane protein isoform X1 [Astyanax mexicanus]|uniref:CXADR-like membrane protein isoform X1 n=1 Tax=Astyanax mexicanus TaxID=7994 RepID=A0A8T2KYS0_ASTMX|nr:CXADR-like membrane protein isoform X1 [Astyanax mexicanus]